MPTRSTARGVLIELHASREEKRLLAAAAAYEHLDVTSFVMRTVLPVAEAIVARKESFVLTDRDSVRILHFLERPPKPTPALGAAAKRRKYRLAR